MPEPARRRRGFVPVVGLGLAAGIVAAVASSRVWVATPGDEVGRAPSGTAFVGTTGVGEMPLASALSLVVLACWGVLLVTRGAVRRGVALVAVLASVALLATVVVGLRTLPDQVREAALEATGSTGETVATSFTVWFWVAAVGALLSAGAAVLATAWCPGWPEMGSRYDAPGSDGPARPVPAEEQSNLELWKQMDEGRDPTA